MKFNMLDFISKLVYFSSRQGIDEIKTAKLIISVLKNNKISYYMQEFETKYPKIKANLKVDGKKIECEGCSFVSGKIKNKNRTANSSARLKFFVTHPGINFNPKCKVISLDNFYFTPALAVNPTNIKKVISAKIINGEIKTKPCKYTSSNILVGNLKSPKNILFAHYDSIKRGATDNASSVSVLIKLIIENPYILKNSLVVFSGNEELSYDYPIYWGHGYREFERKYNNLLKKSKKIFVVECIGNGKTIISKDKKLLLEGFPIKNLKKIERKILLIHGDINKLMSVYHSDLDNVNEIKKKYLLEASNIILKLI